MDHGSVAFDPLPLRLAAVCYEVEHEETGFKQVTLLKLQSSEGW